MSLRLIASLALVLLALPARADPPAPIAGSNLPSADILTTTISLPITLTAYGTGSQLGSLIHIPSAARASKGTGSVKSITLRVPNNNPAAQYITADITFFSGNPSATTFADTTQVSIADADIAKAFGPAHMADCNPQGITVCRVTGSFDYDLHGGTDLYAVITIRNSITFAVTPILSIDFTVQRN